jgi:hypothetical protein
MGAITSIDPVDTLGRPHQHSERGLARSPSLPLHMTSQLGLTSTAFVYITSTQTSSFTSLISSLSSLHSNTFNSQHHIPTHSFDHHVITALYSAYPCGSPNYPAGRVSRSVLGNPADSAIADNVPQAPIAALSASVPRECACSR